MRSFERNQIVSGTVVGRAPFMAYVKLEPDIQAQVPVSEIPGNEENRVVYGLLEEGDVRDFRVTGAVYTTGPRAIVTLSLMDVEQSHQYPEQ